ncbi:hypothetical protein FRC04_004794 [Tulasnella sp. 424]|nr:hypothetical protein FRC04_004794 [Tulasnella sp. 424]
MNTDDKPWSMPSLPSASFPSPTTASAETASTIPAAPGAQSGVVTPTRTTPFVLPDQPQIPFAPITANFPAVPETPSGVVFRTRTTTFVLPDQSRTFTDFPSQQVEFPGSPGFPSQPGDAYRSPIGFVDRAQAPDYGPPPRNLILCFDGTAKYFNDGNTNVIRLFQGLDKMKSDRQICYYQSGIGTSISPTKAVGQISRQVSKAIDMAVAWYLDEHVGLLPKGNEGQIPFAFARYKDKSDDGVQKAHGFKKAFSRHVSIEFMGVWDTVTSVGLTGKTLPFTSHNAVVKTYRQAFALDERRAKFRHNPWTRAAFDGPPPASMPNALSRLKTRRQSLNVGQEQQPPEPLTKIIGTAIRNTLLLRRRTDGRHYRSVVDEKDGHTWQCPDCNFPWGETDCKEVWFAGSHSVTIGARSADVGGGEIDTLKEEHRNNLANPSLLWMVQQIDTRVAGICWAPDAFDDIPTLKAYFDAKRGPTSAKPRTREGSESVLPESVLDELKKDVQGTVHDSLGGVTSWWLLEYIPLWKPFLDGNKQQWKELK